MYPYFVYRGYRLYKSVLADIRGRFDKSYYRTWNPKFLNRSQWFSESEIRSLQLEGLKQLVDHARTKTRYYKDLLEIKSLDDLKTIPILTKKRIRENFDNLKALGFPGFEVRTSGTVSKSTTMKDRRLRFDFGEQRFLSWYRKPLKRICHLWMETDIGPVPKQQGRHLFLPVRHLNNRSDAIRYLALMEQFRPDLLIACANPLKFLAHYALKEGISPVVGVIQSAGENLFPESRGIIEDTFRCEVYNFYGSHELGSMAQDCEKHGDLHLNSERYIVEEVDGRLIFTDLLNYAMPLIRYENQDTGNLSGTKCACGRGLPTLKSLLGRSIDYLLTKKDEWIPVIGPLVRPLRRYEEFDWVDSFQFRQIEKGKVTVLLKPWSESERIPDLDVLKKLLNATVSPDELEFSLEIVNSLILSKSGKQLRVISDYTPWET